jgi:hypothetical protein
MFLAGAVLKGNYCCWQEHDTKYLKLFFAHLYLDTNVPFIYQCSIARKLKILYVWHI